MDFVDQALVEIKDKNSDKPVFLGKVAETYLSLKPYILKHPEIKEKSVLKRLATAERIIIFAVPWLNDKGEIVVNRGFRVQHNSAVGVYKGGIRFDPHLNLDDVMALAFEQTFKNALTGLAIGGAKGGADFNPRDKSENEIMRFCASYMRELYRYLGPETDVPAGDIGVGRREIGYLFGTYKRLTNTFSGSLTGKDASFGGLKERLPATGYGVCYAGNKFLDIMRHDSFKNKKIVVSGIGKVGLHAIKKAIELGGTVIGISDLSGCCYRKDGIDFSLLGNIKENGRGKVSDYALKDKKAVFNPDHHALWDIKCDIVIPCATQNELSLAEVEKLIANGTTFFLEGANMPIVPEAVKYIIENKILYLPGKVANSGGVIVSVLEMTQNATFHNLKGADVQKELKTRMENITQKVCACAQAYGDPLNTLMGANILAFSRLAQAMIQEGI